MVKPRVCHPVSKNYLNLAILNVKTCKVITVMRFEKSGYSEYYYAFASPKAL